MVKRENPNAFVKCFSDSAEIVKKGGLNKLETAMRALHVDKLVLVPRISGAVQASLDDKIKGTLHVAERTVKFTEDMQEIFQLLIEIMQACLDECKIQYKMFVKTFKASEDQLPDRDETQKKLDELLKIENAVLLQFDSELNRIFGSV